MHLLAKRIAELRKKKKLSQIEFAEKFGIGRSTIAMWETGDRKPDAETVQKLADFFDTSTDYLLGRIDSNRSGGFSQDYGSRATKKYLNLRLLSIPEDLPKAIRKEIQTPVLLYHVLQLRDDIPIAISQSYLPSSLPLNRLKKILEGVKQEPTLSLYKTLESFERKPINCEEVLTIDDPSPEEIGLLQMPEHVPVARIIRKTFDASSHLVEYCLLTSRTDLYKFVYRFIL